MDMADRCRRRGEGLRCRRRVALSLTKPTCWNRPMNMERLGKYVDSEPLDYKLGRVEYYYYSTPDVWIDCFEAVGQNRLASH